MEQKPPKQTAEESIKEIHRIPHRQREITRITFTWTCQEAAIIAAFHEQIHSVNTRYMRMEPAATERQAVNSILYSTHLYIYQQRL